MWIYDIKLPRSAGAGAATRLVFKSVDFDHPIIYLVWYFPGLFVGDSTVFSVQHIQGPIIAL
jgi:hypothetical protein